MIYRPPTPLFAIVLLTSVLFISAPHARAQDPSGAGIVATLDSIVAAAAADGFSGQVLVVRDGAVLHHGGTGPIHPARSVDVDTSTVFAIGSVTKRFTRAALLKLEEDGVLQMSDPVSRWISGLPADKQEITVAQLLDMSSGLHEYHDDTGDHQAMTKQEALERIGSQELRFAPGSETAYSNSSYVLAAAVIEEASGRSYEAYLREALLEPAGMERTGFHGEDLWADDEVARGHGMRVHGDNAPHRWPYTWALKGAGGMVAPTSDLARFRSAVLDGRVLGPSGVSELYPRDQPRLAYAGGDDFGFVTVVIEMEHGRDMIVVNTHSGFRVQPLATALAQAVSGESLTMPGAAIETTTDAGTPEGLPDTPRGRAARQLVEALEAGTEAALRELVEAVFTTEMRDVAPMDQHLQILGRLSETLRTAGLRSIRPLDEFTFTLLLGNGEQVHVDVEARPPHGIEGIRVEG